jgi:hypothetical protein
MGETSGDPCGVRRRLTVGYCCYIQGQYRNVNRVTEKRAALPRAPRGVGRALRLVKWLDSRLRL